MKYIGITIFAALVGLSGASATRSPLRPARSEAGRSIPTLCWGLTMHLEPGAQKPPGFPSHGWIGNSWEIARDIPLDAVTAEAPLYPDSMSSRAQLAQNIFMGVPGSNYLKTAASEFSLPAGVGAALHWYRKWFATCGFTAAASTTTGIQFVSSTTPNLHIDVSLEKVSSQSSLVLYYASAESTPARPARSYINDGLPSVSSATVTYTTPNSKSVHFNLTNSLVIFGLADATSQAPVLPVSGCSGLRVGGGALVVFHEPTGRSERLTVSPDCYFSANGSRPISDSDHAVWSYINYLVYKHCFQYGCPSLR